MTAYLLAAAVAFLAAPEAGDFEAFFQEFAEKRDGIVVLEANFTQKTILPEETLETAGTLYYAQPRRVVYRTEDPLRVTLIEQDRGYEYEPDIKQLIVFDLAESPQAKILFLGFDNDTETLREGFDIELFDIEGDTRGSQGLILRPKEGVTDAEFMKVSLYLRDQDFLPYKMHIINDEESEVEITVSDFTINHTPAPERSQIALAPGTKIVENDVVIDTAGKEGMRVPEPLKFEKQGDGPPVRVETPETASEGEKVTVIELDAPPLRAKEAPAE